MNMVEFTQFARKSCTLEVGRNPEIEDVAADHN